jgi:hypothetical protein
MIGTFDGDEVELPLTGAMFHSKDPRHGMPPPFRTPTTPERDMKCPYCQNHPFLLKGYLKTERGHWSIGEKQLVDLPPATTNLRTVIEQRLDQRPPDSHDADIRHRIDLERGAVSASFSNSHQTVEPTTRDLEKIEDQLPEGVAIPELVESDQPGVPPDLEEEPVEEKQGYLDMSDEQKEAEIKKRIEQDESEGGGENGDSRHDSQ